MKKRIIISVTNDLISDQRVHKIATSLHDSGFNIILIGRKLKKSISLDSRKYATKRMSLLFNRGSLFYAEYNFRLFFLLLFSKVDILLSNDLDSLPANYLMSKIRRKIIVYDSHEYFTEVPELVNRPKIKLIWSKIEQLILPKLKNTYTVCESIANEYNTKYNTCFQVIRNVPRSRKISDEVESPFPNNKKIILYQGALNIGRGLEQMIEAMEYIENSLFVLIGDGDISEKLKNLVDTKHLNDKVKFLGKIPFQNLYKYTRFAHLGISLEENMGLNYYFSLPNKLFDYIQAEVPVLVSNFPEMKNIVDTYKIGAICNAKSSTELAMQINTILEDKTTYNLYKKNLNIAAKELVWENEEKNLLKLIEKSIL
ncbi:MAG TPA: glycosyl transferase group 1 [Bacteroidales bacterium]|nr:MAG: hypothetical protein A2W98_11695 [Bacteroidetes bacterium GWF2_33_38]OFY68643.1 MAG: hypothetical protein A2265_02885 [Bacteroidetes bacterium RIFOXYA12_FULL_33_9]OFY88830.1 MAG: hypothetical protein A2236_08445 [Bacteroidetes bacterium RIFOXYA2_FULL_33_7]HBF89412.1 glycosyl transferase group 1 [Bacteroidales bacterium]